MAIAFVSVNNAAGQNAGATGTGTASISATLPSGMTDGRSRVFVVQTGTGVSGTTPANWTALVKDAVIGTGTVTAGGGQRYMSIYYRDKTIAWNAMPAFTLASTSAPSHWVGAVAINPTLGFSFDTPTASSAGSDFGGTVNTAHSDSPGSLTTVAGGFLIIGTAHNDNATMTSGALTQSGATLGTVTERCDGGTATGNDVAGKLHTATVTTGATAGFTFTGTLSAASEGGSIVVHQTESATPKTETFTEDFTALDTTTKWYTEGGVSIISGQLDIPVNLAYDGLAYTLPGRDLTGSSITIQLATSPNTGNGGTEAIIRVLCPNTANLFYIDKNGGGVYVSEIVAGTPSDVFVGSVTDSWFRFRESGGTIYWETSATGAAGSWTVRRSKAWAVPQIQSVTAYLSAGYYGTEPSPGTARFDNFNLPPGGTKTGTASGSYTWAGAAVGDTPANRGAGAGTYTWTGSASGKRTPKAGGSGAYTWAGTAVGDTPPNQGTGAGTHAWAGTSAGRKTPKATASGSHTWAGTATGDTPPNRGATAGSHTWAGSAAGKRTPKAAAAGAHTWAGTATGTAPLLGINDGSAFGSHTWTGAAVGAKTPKGSTAGAHTWAGTAAGKRTPKATATGTYTWAGGSVGDTPPNRGSVTGSYTWTGTAVGDTPPNRGTAAGAHTWAGIASGQTPAEDVQAGSASGFYSFTGTASGIRPSKGTASGFYTFTGTAAGKRTSKASATGAYMWAGTGVGQTPAVGVNDGTAAGSFTWAGVASGARTSRGTTSGSYMWAGIAAGRRVSRGASAGSYTFAGSATGDTPTLLIPQGSATGAYSWTGFAVSGSAHIGYAAGSYTWAGRAWGWLLHLSAERMLVVAAEDRTLTVAAEDRTLRVAAEDRTITVVAEGRTLAPV